MDCRLGRSIHNQYTISYQYLEFQMNYHGMQDHLMKWIVDLKDLFIQYSMSVQYL